MSGSYDDIIDLPHHVSSTRPRMSAHDRAAQFSSFAALRGYEAAVSEAGRLTDARIELDMSQKELLSQRLLLILEQADEHPQVSLTYFVPDTKKSGGSYVTVTGSIKRFDEYEHILIMSDGQRIGISDIYSVESDIFNLPGTDFD